MEISLRSVLTAGVTAATASALVMAPSVAPPGIPDVTVASSNSGFTLAADATPITGQALLSFIESIAPSLDLPAAGQPQAAVPAVNNAASNLIDAVYRVSRYWANYASLDLAPWALGWVPFGYLASDQIYIWYPSFVLPVVDSFVYDFLIPGVNNPLDLQVWLDGLGAIVNTGVDGAVAGAREEINYLLSLQWLPWPVPPLPPLPFAASSPMTATALGPTPLAAGPIGNAVIDASQALADVSNAIWGIWNPIRDGIDHGVVVTSDALSSLSWIPLVPVANFELTSTWNLIAREGNALTGFAHDMIDAGDQAVADFFNLGVLAAADNAFWNTVHSVGARGGEAVDAVADYALGQLDYFTGIYVPHTTVNVPEPTPGPTTSLATPAGDTLEAKLVVTPDAAAQVPASVIDSLDAPQVADPAGQPQAPVTPAQKPDDGDAADDAGAQTPSEPAIPAAKAGPHDDAKADEAEQAAKSEADKAAKAAHHQAKKAAKAKAEKADKAKKAKQDSEADSAKVQATDSDSAAKDDPSGPANKDSGPKQAKGTD